MKNKTLLLSIAATLTLLATAAEVQAKQPEIPLFRQSSDLVTTTKSGMKTTSGKAEIALAQHLRRIGAKFYGAFWCPYCTKQKEVFGNSAFKQIRYIECDPRGQNPRPNLCRQAGVRAYPTWVIKGQTYTGAYSSESLANISGYRGRRDFK
jgi:hypothetical protein